MTTSKNVQTVRLRDVIGPAFYETHRQINRGLIDEVVEKGGRASLKSSYVSVEVILQLIRQAILGQLDPVPRKRRCVYDIAARLDKLPLQPDQYVPVFQHPLFRTHARRHPPLLQVRPGRPVQADNSAIHPCMKLLLCHLSFPRSFFMLRLWLAFTKCSSPSVHMIPFSVYLCKYYLFFHGMFARRTLSVVS